MGTWGTALYSDDLAADLRGDFKDLLGDGLSAEEAVDRLLTEYTESLADSDESTVFWLALADSAWRLGHPVARATQEALRIIERGGDLSRWPTDKERLKREVVLQQLSERLRSPAPPPKRVPKRFVANNQWAVGEVISFELKSGNLALFRVIGHHSDKGGRHAVLEPLDWSGRSLPSELDAGRLPVRAQLYSSGYPQFMCGEPHRPQDASRFSSTGWASQPSQSPGGYSVFAFPHFDRQLQEQFGLE